MLIASQIIYLSPFPQLSVPESVRFDDDVFWLILVGEYIIEQLKKNSMRQGHRMTIPIYLIFSLLITFSDAKAQNFPPLYPTLELFTNTPCPSCGSQNPGLFNRLANFEGQYHLVSFYPGKPYNSCVFYQANITENTARWQFYTGSVFGTPTVAINGIDFKNSNGVNNAVLEGLTGQTSWLEVAVAETTGSSRTVDITLQDHAGGSATTGRLFAVIVEREILYNAPNGETVHHNVFRKFLTASAGVDVDLSSGTATESFTYQVDQAWNADEIYVIAWVMDPDTKEIYNSGTKFDLDFVSSTNNIADAIKMHLFPNPTRGQFTLTLPESHKAGTVKVYNTAGALVYTQNFAAQSEILMDGSAWPEGNYVVRVTIDGKEGSELVRVVR